MRASFMRSQSVEIFLGTNSFKVFIFELHFQSASCCWPALPSNCLIAAIPNKRKEWNTQTHAHTHTHTHTHAHTHTHTQKKELKTRDRAFFFLDLKSNLFHNQLIFSFTHLNDTILQVLSLGISCNQSYPLIKQHIEL